MPDFQIGSSFVDSSKVLLFDPVFKTKTALDYCQILLQVTKQFVGSETQGSPNASPRRNGDVINENEGHDSLSLQDSVMLDPNNADIATMQNPDVLTHSNDAPSVHKEAENCSSC